MQAPSWCSRRRSGESWFAFLTTAQILFQPPGNSHSCFGPKSVNVKPILKTLPKIFAHADKTVRSEGQLLCLALHSYLGPALTPHLGELKPVQQKELGEAFEAADRGEKGDEYGFGKIRPSRYTMSQKRAMAIQEAQGQLDANGHGDEDEGETATDEGMSRAYRTALRVS